MLLNYELISILSLFRGLNAFIANASQTKMVRRFMTDERTRTETASYYIKLELKQRLHFEVFWHFVDLFFKNRTIDIEESV